MNEVEKVAQEYERKIPTPVLNKVLAEAVKDHQPPVFQSYNFV